MLYYVTLYDPKTWEAEEPVPVEAASKQEAAERICRVKLSADAKIEGATASVVRLGEASNRRQYFRRA